MKKLVLAALFSLLASPAFALGPAVVDTTKEEENKPAPNELIAHGTIQAACAPWPAGLSAGIELDNHIGLTLYLSIDSLPDHVNRDFKADLEVRQAGTAVIYRCDENDTNCNQLPGTVTMTMAKNPVYAGRYIIEGEESHHFEVKRIASKAKCDVDSD